MSRIGKKIIIVPKKTDVSIDGSIISVKGPKGELSCQVSDAISVRQKDDIIKLRQNYDSKESRALYGLYRTFINNMIVGVSEGFSKKLSIQGVGYRSQMNGNNLVLNVGYSHPVQIDPPKGVSIKVENNTQITVFGLNKEVVGQIAAKIREVRPPEPYKGKGIRYLEEKVRRKVGKAGK
uniref:ribosomal protein L6 n=1 Tax=Gloiopeltis furcata TaxID=42017 RepID=UPI0028D739DA|nr:ribosomal protein L6 [Gloiopeltis furcata]WMP13936.1 ribosomal protein L6 [Gloiopeltis furcata]